LTTINIDSNLCDGCGMCECPNGVLEIKEDKAIATDPDSCMVCGFCETECPQGAITVEE